MTEQEIIEGNKLIASFMQHSYIPIKAGYERGRGYTSVNTVFTSLTECFEYCQKINQGRDPEECFFPLPNCKNFELKYHTSWDWLMPVVEKIKSTEKNWPIATDQVLSLSISTPISAVYKAVIDFIQWYNAQPKQS